MHICTRHLLAALVASPVPSKHNLTRPHAKTQVHFLSRVTVTVQYFPRKSTEHAGDDKWFHKGFIPPKRTSDVSVNIVNLFAQKTVACKCKNKCPMLKLITDIYLKM